MATRKEVVTIVASTLAIKEIDTKKISYTNRRVGWHNHKRGDWHETL